MTTINPASGSTRQIPAAILQPVYRREEYTVSGAVLKFLEERVKDVAKVFSYSVAWAGHALPDLDVQVRTFGSRMADFKNFISITEAPKKAIELWEGFKGFWSDLTKKSGPWVKTASAAREVFKRSAAFANSVVDSIDFGARFIPIQTAVMTWVKGIGFAATLGGSGNSAVEQVQSLADPTKNEPKQKTLYMINLARDVSYVVLGVLGLVATLTATPIASWMLLACATSGLTFTISSYFYEKLYDPDHKGKNLNPEVVVSNDLQRRKYEAQQRLAMA